MRIARRHMALFTERTPWQWGSVIRPWKRRLLTAYAVHLVYNISRIFYALVSAIAVGAGSATAPLD